MFAPSNNNNETLFIMILTINLKIEAKSKLTSQQLNALQRINNLSRCNTIKLVYNAFDCDAFLLPYKVRKLSKRAKRNNI